MATLTLTPTGGSALNLLDPTAITLEREGTIDTLFPPPAYDEEYAESSDTEGARRSRSRAQNPTGSGRVKIVGSTSTTFWANVRTWQQTAEAVRRDGGTFSYTPTNGTAITYDIESFALLSLPQDNVLTTQNVGESEFTFTCLPYARLASVQLATNTTSTEPVFSVVITSSALSGSVDALGKLTLTDLATQDRDHWEVGLDPDYNAASPAPVFIDSADLVTAGYAGVATSRSGAYGGGNNVIRATLTSVPVGVCATSSGLQHTRRWRIKARVYAAGTGPVWVRLRYKVGDGPLSEADKGWVRVPQIGAFCELDLGLVAIAPVIQGATGWTGRIEAYSSTTGDTIDVDYLIPLPAYRYFKAKGRLGQIAQSYSAYDSFEQTSGALSGKSLPAPAGQTWGGAGDADDFTVDASEDRAQRSAVSDSAGVQNGRFGQAGSSSYGAIALRTTFGRVTQIAAYDGVYARYTDTNNFLLAYWYTEGPTLNIVKRVAGVTTTLASKQAPLASAGSASTLQLFVTTDGRLYAWYAPGQTLSDPLIVLQDADLATGGSLASGKIGIWDHKPEADASTRFFNDFTAWVPELNHAINSGKSAQLLHNAAIREPSGGAVWGRVPLPEGAYLKLPPNRALRVVVKARRFDVDEMPDPFISDNLRADLSATPRAVLLG